MIEHDTPHARPPARKPAIALQDVTLAYGRHLVVQDVSGVFPLGESTAIVGPNGAGKSSLLKSIVGLVPLRSGRIDLGGTARADIAYLPQQSTLDRSFPITVRELVALGDWHRSAWTAAHGRPVHDRIEQALTEVGMEAHAHQPLDALSTGQFQRVLFARLCVQDASVILLDEPFAGVDAPTTRMLLGLVDRWHAQARTVIAVLHDLRQVDAHFSEVVLLDASRAIWGPAAEVLSPARLGMAAHSPWCGAVRGDA